MASAWAKPRFQANVDFGNGGGIANGRGEARIRELEGQLQQLELQLAAAKASADDSASGTEADLQGADRFKRRVNELERLLDEEKRGTQGVRLDLEFGRGLGLGSRSGLGLG